MKRMQSKPRLREMEIKNSRPIGGKERKPSKQCNLKVDDKRRARERRWKRAERERIERRECREIKITKR